MREAPILFNRQMVPLVLDGSKTQTRRPIKVPEGGSARAIFDGTTNELLGARTYAANSTEYGWQKPIANVGDVLWARETWNKEGGALTYLADGDWIADYAAGEPADYAARKARGLHPKWRPSIHMPRWASRVTLPLVSVRVERVITIKHDAAVAEGFADSGDFLTAWRDIYGTAEWCFVYEWSKAVIR